MRIAVLADIHGNAPALEAVLAFLSGQRFDRIVHLGDAFNGPIDPIGVARLLRAIPMAHVRGNGERMILRDDPGGRSRSASFARGRLNRDDLNWMATWPLVHTDRCSRPSGIRILAALEQFNQRRSRSGARSLRW